MQKMELVYLLYGFFVRDHFMTYHELDVFKAQQLWSFCYRQVDMWQQGIKDVSLHDITCVMLSSADPRP